MAARNAFVGLALSVCAAGSVANSPIPVVSAAQSSPGNAAQATYSQAVSAAPGQQVSAVQAAPAMLLNQMETMQQEVMELRGLVEEQANAIDRLEKENRDRYLDLDRRISQLAAGGSSSTSVKVPGVSSGSSATQLPAVIGEVTAGSAQSGASGEALYQDAFQLIRDRKFPEAVAGLKKYISEHPTGDYVDNAQYWLGEVHLAQGDLGEAEAAFLRLIKKYPLSSKIDDATYKLGQVYDRQGKTAKAKSFLKKTIKDFPGSSAARLADVYLRNLKG